MRTADCGESAVDLTERRDGLPTRRQWGRNHIVGNGRITPIGTVVGRGIDAPQVHENESRDVRSGGRRGLLTREKRPW